MPLVRQDSGTNSGFMQALHITSDGASMSRSRQVPVVKQNTCRFDVHDLHKSQNSFVSPSHNESARVRTTCKASTESKPHRSISRMKHRVWQHAAASYKPTNFRICDTPVSG